MRSISLILEKRLLTLVMNRTAEQVVKEDLKRLNPYDHNQFQVPYCETWTEVFSLIDGLSVTSGGHEQIIQKNKDAYHAVNCSSGQWNMSKSSELLHPLNHYLGYLYCTQIDSNMVPADITYQNSQTFL